MMSDRSKKSQEKAPYKMDPETKAAMERSLERHKEALRRLAKL